MFQLSTRLPNNQIFCNQHRLSVIEVVPQGVEFPPEKLVLLVPGFLKQIELDLMSVAFEGF